MKKLLLFVNLLLLFACLGVRAQTIPNGDFETWTSYNNYAPDSGWYNSNVQSLIAEDSLTVWSVTGVSGQAIHIQTAIVGRDTLQAWITNSIDDPQMGIGGVPYSQSPTGITGYYRYNLPGNDSAGIAVFFKKSGTIISSNMFKIRNASGSLSSFTPFSFPIPTLSVTPDTVIIAITSSNLFGAGLQSGSWIEIDELAFTGIGITQPIPDGNFDTWVNTPVQFPTGWSTFANFNGDGLSQSSDAYIGSYSCQLVSTINYDNSGARRVVAGEITNGHMPPNSGPTGGRPYTLTSDTLFGYYKYAPVGSDTAFVSLNLTHLGSSVGGGSVALTAASSWTLFTIPIGAMSTPDTLLLSIQSSSYNNSSITAGSTLKVDHLWLKSQPLGIDELSAAANTLVYPNPANDVLNFRLDAGMQGPVTIYLYDMMGRVIDSKYYASAPSIATFQVGYLPFGLYFCEVSNNGVRERSKFIKQ